MREECITSDARESAMAQKSEAGFASDAHFRPFDDCREFARLKIASSASESRRPAPSKKIAGVEFSLGTQRFLQQLPGVVTSFPNRKFAARPATPLEKTPNQTSEPTAPSGRGSP